MGQALKPKSYSITQYQGLCFKSREKLLLNNPAAKQDAKKYLFRYEN